MGSLLFLLSETKILCSPQYEKAALRICEARRAIKRGNIINGGIAITTVEILTDYLKDPPKTWSLLQTLVGKEITFIPGE